MYLWLRGKNVSAFIKLMSSVYLISKKTLSSKNSTSGESVLVEATSLQNLQRVVAFLCFHGNENRIFEGVMMENDENYDAIDGSKTRSFSVWLAEALAFLSLYIKVSSKCLEKSFSRPSLS